MTSVELLLKNVCVQNDDMIKVAGKINPPFVRTYFLFSGGAVFSVHDVIIEIKVKFLMYRCWGRKR